MGNEQGLGFITQTKMMSKIFVLLCVLGALCREGSATDGLFFSETFDEDPFESGKWFKSSDEKYANQPIKVTAASKPAAGFEGDKGVQLTMDMKHYGFGTQFPEPLDIGQGVYIQYEVKLEETLNCGGAYIKLPMTSEGLNLKAFSSDTPYTIMFGPDRCGTNNKVHFILQYQNPISMVWEEKHYNETIPIKTDDATHLYTLAIYKDSGFDIFIDGVLINSGSLLHNMIPAINPPSEIDDIEDKKPADWVDAPEIFDPMAVKPEDWDESQPSKIPDPTASKPEEWDEEAPAEIPDPSASKPEDWDDEEDGVWDSPTIINPVCESSGCGVWSPPMIVNPEFKGKWSAPRIPNPDYIGLWAPKKTANPNYFYHESPLQQLPSIAGLVVEVWTTSGAILFDNFAISLDMEPMAEFTSMSFKLKMEAEQVIKEAAQKEEKKAERVALMETGGMREQATAFIMEAIDFLTENPTVLAATVACIVATFLYLVLFGGQDAAIEMEQAAAARAADAARVSSASSSSSSSATNTDSSESKDD